MRRSRRKTTIESFFISPRIGEPRRSFSQPRLVNCAAAEAHWARGVFLQTFSSSCPAGHGSRGRGVPLCLSVERQRARPCDRMVLWPSTQVSLNRDGRTAHENLAGWRTSDIVWESGTFGWYSSSAYPSHCQLGMIRDDYNVLFCARATLQSFTIRFRKVAGVCGDSWGVDSSGPASWERLSARPTAHVPRGQYEDETASEAFGSRAK